MPEVAVALDVQSADAALALVDRLPPDADFFKVGLELFSRAGPAVVRELRRRELRIFLDLKLHDIPNTVRGAARAAAELEAEFLTVHASGGPRMIEAARTAVEGSGTRIAAVTLLTSLARSDLHRMWGQAAPGHSTGAARLASVAMESGAHGVVAAAREARMLRARLPGGAFIVTPAIRLSGSSHDDQAAVATPAAAARAGADLLVVGRTVTGASDPRAAFRRVRAELAGR